MEAFFAAYGYPHDLITRARLRAEEKQRTDLLVTTAGSNCTAADQTPLVIIYHPKNIAVCNILLRNYTILRDDDNTKVTFYKPQLITESLPSRLKPERSFRSYSSLKQVPQRQMGTFHCNRSDCRTCPFINPSDHITTTQGHFKMSAGVFYVHHQPADLLHFAPQMPWGRLHRRDKP